MPNIGTAIKGLVGRALPSATNDQIEAEFRTGRYGEQYVNSLVPTKHVLADEGQYFVATNPTVGTGVAHALTTTYSTTQGLFVIKNNDTASSGKRIYLDYMRLMLTSVGATAGVSLEFAYEIDNGSRTASGLVATIPAVNVNMDSAVLSVSVFQAFSGGQPTVPAPSGSARVAGRTKMPLGGGAPGNVTGDVYIVQFGAADLPAALACPATTRTGAAQIVSTAPPIVIGPQQYCVIHRWCLTEATTAPSYEYEVGWWER